MKTYNYSCIQHTTLACSWNTFKDTTIIRFIEFWYCIGQNNDQSFANNLLLLPLQQKGRRTFPTTENRPPNGWTLNSWSLDWKSSICNSLSYECCPMPLVDVKGSIMSWHPCPCTDGLIDDVIVWALSTCNDVHTNNIKLQSHASPVKGDAYYFHIAILTRW